MVLKRVCLQSNIAPFLVRRYLRFNKSQPFISIAAILAFLGVCVGVMVLIVAMALMNGFDKEFQRKLFIMNYPITMIGFDINKHTLEDLQQNFPHLKASPFIQTQAISKSQNTLEGGIIFGIDYELESQINPVFKEALENTKSFYKKNYNEEYKQGTFDVIIGQNLANLYNLNYQSNLLLIFTNLTPNAITLAPSMKNFKVNGFFSSGLIAYDKGYIYTSLQSLRILKNMKEDSYDGIHIYSDNPQKDIIKLKETYGDKRIVGWWEQNGNFFAALELEKRTLFIVLMLIILVASLNIISSLLMTIMNRRKEIALLLTMGASPKEIKKTFLYLGNLIGISGIICGCILAAIALFLLSHFPIISLPADVYGSSKLPLELSIFDLCSILFGSLLIVFFSSYYPAKKATEVDCLQVLRNE